MNEALVILKPDSFERNLVETLLELLIREFDLVEAATLKPSQERWEKHYAEHKGKAFYDGLIQAMSDKQTLFLVLRSADGVRAVRTYCEGLRGVYVDTDYVGPRNLVHCSDSEDSAQREIELWFGEESSEKEAPQAVVKKSKSARQASKIDDKVKFTEMVTDFIRGGDYPKARKDIEKVQFDFENYGYTDGEYKVYSPLMGMNEIDGFEFCGCAAGGDWEYPVFFLLYLDKDGKTLRSFVPKKGNCWNYNTNEAWGNDEEADAKLYNKVMGNDDGEDAYDCAAADEGDCLIYVADIIDTIKKRFVVV